MNQPATEPQAEPLPAVPRRTGWLNALAFVVILLAAAYFRFAGLNWDENQHLHPDERFLTMVTTAVQIPDTLADYFNSKTSPLNPYNENFGLFVYGDFPITFTRLVAEGLTSACAPAPGAPIDATTGRRPPSALDSVMRALGFDQFCAYDNGTPRAFASYDEVTLLGRALSGLFDLATLVWLFLIGRELYGTRAGLVAMALGGLAVMHLQQAHFYTADTFATTFVTMAMYFIVRAGKTGSWFDLIATGVASGLAIASRINVAPVLGILGIAMLGRAVRAWRTPGGTVRVRVETVQTQDPSSTLTVYSPRASRENSTRVETALLQVIVATAVAAITFRIFMPYAFDGLLSFDARWSGNMSYIQQCVSGEDPCGPPGVQWTDRTPIVFPWVNMVFWGMGLPFGLAAWIGWAFVTWKLWVKPYRSPGSRTIGEWLRGVVSSKHVLIWVWVTAYFVWQGSQWVKSMRYQLPVYPFLAIIAGWFLVSMWTWARRSLARARALRAFAYALPVLVVIGTLLWAIAFTEIYRQPVSRVTASDWIYENVPSAATLHYADASGARSVQLQVPNATMFSVGAPQVIGFTVPTNGELKGITFRDLRDPGAASADGSLTLVVAQDVSAAQTIARATVADAFQAGPVEVDFNPAPLHAGTSYYLIGSAESVPVNFSAALIADAQGQTVTVQAGAAAGLPPNVLTFSVPQDSTLLSATARVSGVPSPGSAADLLQVKIALDPGATQIAAQGQLAVPSGAPGGSYSLTLEGAQLKAGQQYYFVGEAARGSLVATSSALADEHWDDPIPLRTGGRDGYSFYRGVEMQNYNDDTPDKVGQLVGWLEQADYIFLTSNRLYGSIPRQPLRYPLTSEYYRLLFTGQLGFDEVAEFTSYPTIGPFEFPDQETTQALGLWPDPTRMPKPGMISVPFPPAEEVFTVYDHPRVLIFKKRADFSLQDVIQKLSRFDLEAAYHGFTPKFETAAPSGLLLDKQTWQEQQTSGTWSQLFDRNSLLNANPGLGALVWYALVVALGWAAFPLLYVAVPGLADRGYGLARTLGVLLLSFLIWFPASFKVLPFTRETIWLMAAVMFGVGALIAWPRRNELRDFVRRNARLILIEEIVFAAGFVLFLLIRYGNPDLWHPWKGGEKPMDFAYFNAVIKSQYFPPYDPWYAGGYITYYYYGFVVVATITKMLGTVPAIAYNFVVPMLYALAAMGTFSVAHGLASYFGFRTSAFGFRKSAFRIPKSEIAVGVIAAVFVMLMGNLGEVQLLSDELSKIGQTGFKTTIPALKTIVDAGGGLLKVASGQKAIEIPSDWWYWNPTRIIPAPEGEAGPITELPFFTFTYADLHAHMMALPITILALGLAVSWLTCVPLRRRDRSPASLPPASLPPAFLPLAWLRDYWPDLLSLLLAGLAVGALRATNTWDFPTYLGIGVVALAFGTWASESLLEKETWPWFVVRAGLFGVLALALFTPFASKYATGFSSIEAWQGSRTEFWPYVYIHGIFLFPIVTYLFVEMRRWGWRWIGAAWRRLGEWRGLISIPIVLALLIMLYFALTGVTIAVIAAPIMIVTLAMLLRPRLPAGTRFWLLLVLLAMALSFTVEVVVLRGDISRMNTVFKFYYQIWVLLGIAGAVSLGWLWRRVSIHLPRLDGAWQTAMVVLIAGGMLYPPFAARAKIGERFTPGSPPGLDGMAYMANARYLETDNEWNLRWDFDALTWMQDNIQGTPVVAEGNSRHEYLWGGRVSIYTGLPTLFGWQNHQRQQRSVAQGMAFDRHIQDVALLYGDTGRVTARKIIDRYTVKYIYVGQLERGYYPAESLAKFDTLAADGELRVVYQNPGTTIYEVVK